MKNYIINRLNEVARESFARFGYSIDLRKIKDGKFPIWIEKDFITFLKACRGNTLVPWEALHMNYQAAKWVTRYHIPGDVVECGVFRGGSILMMAKTIQASENTPDRCFWLYDTFEGMSAPDDRDISLLGPAHDSYKGSLRKDGTSNWCRVDIDAVKALLAEHTVGLKTAFVKGKVEDTLNYADNLPKVISILRLDTDFYESTKKEMEVLYPLLADGGVLIADDYLMWLGSRQAIDEYFSNNNIKPSFFIDPQSGRIMHFKRA
ncbi:MAG: TylF/MycF family methyltransferase [Methylacidiphilales bacterium]|nr:TylF/MycF family methyltransferase [Candidatus Methylacidiphilales bacterium]